MPTLTEVCETEKIEIKDKDDKRYKTFSEIFLEEQVSGVENLLKPIEQEYSFDSKMCNNYCMFFSEQFFERPYITKAIVTLTATVCTWGNIPTIDDPDLDDI
ncbi:MAG: hypothetical protein KJ767_01655 [Nanoarchaeota archaeon]|nr:hypothetical protein [Nanoarchaeota archaeon]